MSRDILLDHGVGVDLCPVEHLKKKGGEFRLIVEEGQEVLSLLGFPEQPHLLLLLLPLSAESRR